MKPGATGQFGGRAAPRPGSGRGGRETGGQSAAVRCDIRGDNRGVNASTARIDETAARTLQGAEAARVHIKVCRAVST